MGSPKRAVVLPPMLTPSDPRYTLETYSVAQAAGYLGIAVCRVYQHASTGELAHLKDGARRLRFSQADLDAWRQRRRVEARAETRTFVPVPVARQREQVGDIPLPRHRRFKH